MVLIGIGAGLSFPSVMTLAMTGVRPEEAGLASGLVNTTLQVGGALGLAVLATLSTNRTGNLEASGHGVHDALTSGYQLAFGVGAGLVVLGLVVAITVIRSGSPAAEVAARRGGRGRAGVQLRGGIGDTASVPHRVVYVVRALRAT